MKTYLIVFLLLLVAPAVFADTWYYNTFNLNLNKPGGITRHPLTNGHQKMILAGFKCEISGPEKNLPTARKLTCDLGTSLISMDVSCAADKFTAFDLTPKGKDGMRVVVLCEP